MMNQEVEWEEEWVVEQKELNDQIMKKNKTILKKVPGE